jgi:hypothetical protein
MQRYTGNNSDSYNILQVDTKTIKLKGKKGSLFSKQQNPYKLLLRGSKDGKLKFAWTVSETLQMCIHLGDLNRYPASYSATCLMVSKEKITHSLAP